MCVIYFFGDCVQRRAAVIGVWACYSQLSPRRKIYYAVIVNRSPLTLTTTGHL